MRTPDQPHYRAPRALLSDPDPLERIARAGAILTEWGARPKTSRETAEWSARLAREKLDDLAAYARVEDVR